MALGEKLKEVRRQHDLTQEELAAEVRVSRAAMAKWESSKGTSDICDIINNLKDTEEESAFFLIDDDGRSYLVYIDREFMEASEFVGPLPTKRFRVGDCQLTPGRVYHPDCKQRHMDPKASEI